MSKKVDETQIEQPSDLDVTNTPDPAHQAITTDEFAGQGGSYVFDPVTNTRTKV